MDSEKVCGQKLEVRQKQREMTEGGREEQRRGDTWPLLRRWGRGCAPRHAVDFQKLEKVGNRFSLRASKVNASLGFGPMKDLQICKVIFHMVLGL